MTFIEMLREAVRRGDWGLASEALRAATGERLEPPGGHREALLAIRAAADAALGGEPQPQPQPQPPVRFEEIDVPFKPGVPPKEYREPYREVSVTCGRCGAAESVHPDCAPRALDKGERTTHLCQSCIRGGR